MYWVTSHEQQLWLWRQGGAGSQGTRRTSLNPERGQPVVSISAHQFFAQILHCAACDSGNPLHVHVCTVLIILCSILSKLVCSAPLVNMKPLQSVTNAPPFHATPSTTTTTTSTAFHTGTETPSSCSAQKKNALGICQHFCKQLHHHLWSTCIQCEYPKAIIDDGNCPLELLRQRTSKFGASPRCRLRCN